MTAPKAASKSEAKRVSAQKEAKASKPVFPEQEVLDRLQVLEARQKIIVDSFQFAADECRPIYGLGGIAVIFDAVARKLK